MGVKRQLTVQQKEKLIKTLRQRFEGNMNRHPGISWREVETRLSADEAALGSVGEMEGSGGEPDVVGFDRQSGKYVICDCSKESPKGRRNLCYDREGEEARKTGKPEGNALDRAQEMGIELLTEEQYRQLQELGEFDTTTSSWIKTPDDIRNRGGALFADCRYSHVFVYHNGAPSYYQSRGFRGRVEI